MNRPPLAVLLLALATSAGWSEPNTWRGGDKQNPTDWHTAANWSSKAAPGPDAAGEVLIPSGLANYPSLSADAAVGGSLRLAEKAWLTLDGHCLTVGAGVVDTVDGPDTMYSPRDPKGLIIEKDAVLDASGGRDQIHIRLGGLVSQGDVRGKPTLRVEGVFHGFLLQANGLTLGRLLLAPSPFPYQVRLAGGDLSVTGDVELSGGNLVAASKLLTIGGNLIFRGKNGPACLAPQNDVKLLGTILSEGSASFVSRAEGWVWLAGKGDQTIAPGGILPPIRIGKPSGQVAVDGDLHCWGLRVDAGNTLDLKEGQSLVFGSGSPEWRIDPKDKRILAKQLIPVRTCRDLINDGTILGAPTVPIVFNLNIENVRYAVRASYHSPRREKAEAGPGTPGTGPMVQGFGSGSLSINEPDSRIALKGGKLFLDGKLAPEAGVAPEEQEMEEMGEEDEGPAPAEKAGVSNLSVSEVVAPAVPENLFNVAPYVKTIRSVPSVGLGVASEPSHGFQGLYALVDGRTSTAAGFRSGVMKGGVYEFIFPGPVTVSAVRFCQGKLYASRHVLYADTTNDGICETILTTATDGAPGAWCLATFAATKLHRLKFRGIAGQFGWEFSFPTVSEFEIYADEPSQERVRKADPPPEIAPMPQEARRFSAGPVVKVEWPEPAPEDTILTAGVIDYWNVGLGVESQQARLKTHVKENPAFLKTVGELKDLGYNVVQLYVEAAPAVSWPSINFRSTGNLTYLEKRELAKIKVEDVSLTAEAHGADEEEDEEDLGLDEFPDEDEDEGDEEEEAKGPEDALRVEDLPCQKSILKELVEGMHEHGLKVTVIYSQHGDRGIMSQYIGPKDQDPWMLLLEETTRQGVDGVYVMEDEAYFGRGYPHGKDLPEDDPHRIAFRERWGPDAELPDRYSGKTLNHKRWTLSSYELLGQKMRRRHELVKSINPDCLTLALIGSHALDACNNRLTYCLAYDVIGHLADLDYFGSDYRRYEMRRFTAAAKNRRGAMGIWVPKSVREAVQCVMQGALMVSHWRHNLSYDHGSTEHRKRENAFLKALARWGATRRTRANIAYLVSRASEDWWDMNHGTYWMGWDPDGKQGFWTARLMNEFLLRNGYQFDIYYLDQLEDLKGIGDYKLILLPFPYSVTREAAAILEKARAGGSKLFLAQKQGEVDEIGREHDTPVLRPLIERGQEDGSVFYLDRNLVEYEQERSFTAEMKGLLDGLLGEHKQLRLYTHGCNVEAYVSAISPREQYLTILNWQEDEADIEVGLNLPEGDYKLLTLSAKTPGEGRQGLIGGKRTVTAEELGRFAVKLEGKEVRLFYIVPSDRNWCRR